MNLQSVVITNYELKMRAEFSRFVISEVEARNWALFWTIYTVDMHTYPHIFIWDLRYTCTKCYS